MGNFKGHLTTVCHHRRLVRKYCFRVGLYWQGLTHDLSKFSPVEFLVGVRYFQGDHSPNEVERIEKGYSSSWLHHKGRNKHHLEYWIDYSPEGEHLMCGMKMPTKYVVEMICDRIAASRTYKKADYNDACPWEYYARNKGHLILHPETRALMEKLLLKLKDQGEDATLDYIRKEVLGKR